MIESKTNGTKSPHPSNAKMQEITSDDNQQNYNSPPSPSSFRKGSAPQSSIKAPNRKLSVIDEELEGEVQADKSGQLRFKGSTPSKSKGQPRKNDSRSPAPGARNKDTKDIFKGLEKQTQIDDLYDVQVLQPGYTLYTLREGNVLNSIGLDTLDEFNSSYINNFCPIDSKAYEVSRQLSKDVKLNPRANMNVPSVN